MKMKLAAAAIVLLFSASAFAVVSLGQYKTERARAAKDQQLLTVYIAAIAEAYSWVNIDMASKLKPELFCAPDHGSIPVELILVTIDGYLLSDNAKFYKPDIPIALILLGAMQDKYPCGR